MASSQRLMLEQAMIEQKVDRFIEHLERTLAEKLITRDDYNKGVREVRAWAKAKLIAQQDQLDDEEDERGDYR